MCSCSHVRVLFAPVGVVCRVREHVFAGYTLPPADARGAIEGLKTTIENLLMVKLSDEDYAVLNSDDIRPLHMRVNDPTRTLVFVGLVRLLCLATLQSCAVILVNMHTVYSCR